MSVFRRRPCSQVRLKASGHGNDVRGIVTARYLVSAGSSWQAYPDVCLLEGVWNRQVYLSFLVPLGLSLSLCDC